MGSQYSDAVRALTQHTETTGILSRERVEPRRDSLKKVRPDVLNAEPLFFQTESLSAGCRTEPPPAGRLNGVIARGLAAQPPTTPASGS